MVLRVFFFSELAQSSQNVSVYLLYSKFKICHLLSTFSDPLPVRAKVLDRDLSAHRGTGLSQCSQCQPLGKGLIFLTKKTKQHQFKQRLCVCLFSCVGLFGTVAHQAPLSMGFPKQESWSGQPFPSPGDLPHPGFKAASTALAGRFFFFLATEPPGKSNRNDLFN